MPTFRDSKAGISINLSLNPLLISGDSKSAENKDRWRLGFCRREAGVRWRGETAWKEQRQAEAGDQGSDPTSALSLLAVGPSEPQLLFRSSEKSLRIPVPFGGECLFRRMFPGLEDQGLAGCGGAQLQSQRLQKLRQEALKFKDSVGNVVRPCLKI